MKFQLTMFTCLLIFPRPSKELPSHILFVVIAEYLIHISHTNIQSESLFNSTTNGNGNFLVLAFEF